MPQDAKKLCCATTVRGLSGFLWFLLFLLGGLVLAYQRISLLTTTFVYGAALLVAGRADSVGTGIRTAAQAIDTGAAQATLERMVRGSHAEVVA